MNIEEMIAKTKEQIEFWKESIKHSPSFMIPDIKNEEIDYCESVLDVLNGVLERDSKEEAPKSEEAFLMRVDDEYKRAYILDSFLMMQVQVDSSLGWRGEGFG